MAAQNYRLKWNGKQQKKRVQEAAKGAIDETMALCVGRSVSTVHVVTGVLQGGINFSPAEVQSGEVAGEWGVRDVNYAIYEEKLHPFLVPAADAYYGGLPERIKKRLK